MCELWPCSWDKQNTRNLYDCAGKWKDDNDYANDDDGLGHLGEMKMCLGLEDTPTPLLYTFLGAMLWAVAGCAFLFSHNIIICHRLCWGLGRVGGWASLPWVPFIHLFIDRQNQTRFSERLPFVPLAHWHPPPSYKQQPKDLADDSQNWNLSGPI